MVRQRTLRDHLVILAGPPVVVAIVTAATLTFAGNRGTTASFGLVALGAAVLAGGWSTLVGRTLIRSLRVLVVATEDLAEAQAEAARGERDLDDLPSLGGADPAAAGDELGRLACAVASISASATELARAERESVRKGLATMVMNLARRNQSLLDRQVEYLDELERSEENPDRLGELFRVDHLATRMRRNAESLLVLAGADPGRRRGAPVPVSDVLRVAIGEVENYQHIEIGHIDDAPVPAAAAVDLAHLAAELMENATQFSPPSTTVEVQAVSDRASGCYTVSIRDHGMGLGDRLDAANETLANPPELGLGLGRTLGFMVVGRLAHRLGAEVTLAANDGGGTTASVRLPLSLFQPAAATPVVPAPAAAESTALDQPPTLGPPPALDSPADAPTPPPALAPPALRAPNASSSAALERLLGIVPPTPPAPAPVDTPPAVTPPAVTPVRADAPPPAVAPPPIEAPAVPMAPAPVALPPAPAPRPAAVPQPAALEQTPVTAPEPMGPLGPRGPLGSSPGELPPLRQPMRPTAPQPPTAGPQAADPLAPAPLEDRPGNVALPYPPPMPPPETATPRRADDVDWQTTSPFDLGAPPAWTPPPVTPWSSTGATPAAPLPPPAGLAEALPSGDAFEQGVASLLGRPDFAPPGPDTRSNQPPVDGLQRRQRGASNVPIGEGRPVAAPRRSPEEVREMLSRYRQGLKGGGRDRHVSPWPTDERPADSRGNGRIDNEDG